MDEPTLLSHLRAGTREAHERTESVSGLNSVPMRRDDYATSLMGLHRAHAVATAWLMGAMPPVPVTTANVELLEADLAALGESPLPSAGFALDVEPTPAASIGVQYVVEGSTMGGTILSKRVFDDLELSSDAGASFFGQFALPAANAPGGALTRWRELVRLLKRPATPEEMKQSLAAALATFDLFTAAFRAASQASSQGSSASPAKLSKG